MRLWALLAAGLATAAAFAACASSQTAPGVADAGDGSNQAIGTTCNPSLKEPCAQPSDVCSVAVCDPTTLLCTRVPVDAGPTCSNGSPRTPARRARVSATRAKTRRTRRRSTRRAMRSQRGTGATPRSTRRPTRRRRRGGDLPMRAVGRAALFASALATAGCSTSAPQGPACTNQSTAAPYGDAGILPVPLPPPGRLPLRDGGRLLRDDRPIAPTGPTPPPRLRARASTPHRSSATAPTACGPAPPRHRRPVCVAPASPPSDAGEGEGGAG